MKNEHEGNSGCAYGVLESFTNHDTQGVCIDEPITAVDMTPDIKASRAGFGMGWGRNASHYFGVSLVSRRKVTLSVCMPLCYITSQPASKYGISHFGLYIHPWKAAVTANDRSLSIVHFDTAQRTSFWARVNRGSDGSVLEDKPDHVIRAKVPRSYSGNSSLL